MSNGKASFHSKLDSVHSAQDNAVWEKRVFPPGCSDGDQSKWPSRPYRSSDDQNYLKKLAQEWAKRDGSERLGVNYSLDRLPDGYACFEVDQPGGPQTYKRLFGHPSGKFYDSIMRFQPHFFWLLDRRQAPCPCINCGNYKPQAPPKPRSKHVTIPGRSLSAQRTSLRPDRPSRAGSAEDDESSLSASTGVLTDRSRRAARGMSETWPVDEEGTRNKYKEAVTLAFRNRDSRYAIDMDIDETDSIDWNAERSLLQGYLTTVDQQHSFVPRIGELVLWIPNFPEDHYIVRTPHTAEYRVYDFKRREYKEFPQWRAGIVVSVPVNVAKNGPIDFPDLLETPEKKTDISTSGFRIETMVDPNCDEDKSASKQYKYVALKYIRPLSLWQIMLEGIAREHLDSSIKHALTCMTSISLVDKHRFIGDWQNGGCFRAKAAFLGSELITIGDAVRLLPEGGERQCADVLVVNEIRLRVSGFKEQHQDMEDRTICSAHFISFVGQAYTVDLKHAVQNQKPATAARVYLPEELPPEHVKSTFRPVGSAAYGSWWPLHPASAKLEVSYEQVLGRLYEADAIRIWTGQQQRKFKTGERNAKMKPGLSYDMAGIIAARKYATATDERLPEAPKDEIRWLISDSRSQALTLETVNGLKTAAYDETRTKSTLAHWRMHMKIVHGEPITAGMFEGDSREDRPKPRYYFGDQLPGIDMAPMGRRRGRPTGSKVIDGRLYTAAELAKNPELISATTSKSANEADVPTDDGQGGVGDVTDEGEYSDLEIPETQNQSQTPKRASQMAGAALVSTDEEEIASYYEEHKRGIDKKTRLHRRPFHSRLAAYEINSGDELHVNDEVNSNESADDGSDAGVGDITNLSAWQKPAAAAAPSKSQIMESVERGHEGTIDAIQGHSGYDSDDESEDEWDSQKLREWQDPRNARGGTEESSGGDYQPD